MKNPLNNPQIKTNQMDEKKAKKDKEGTDNIS